MNKLIGILATIAMFVLMYFAIVGVFNWMGHRFEADNARIKANNAHMMKRQH